VVAQKPVLRRASPLSVTWLACTIGAITCLPYAGSLVHGIGHAGGSTIAWMIYLGVAPTAAGFVLWAYALARTTAGRMGSTTYLVPPLALLFGWAFLAEVPPALVFPGGVLCLAGVALARTGNRPALQLRAERHDEPPHHGRVHPGQINPVLAGQALHERPDPVNVDPRGSRHQPPLETGRVVTGLELRAADVKLSDSQPSVRWRFCFHRSCLLVA
jgi:uncharacterized membrane protein